jgi:hypothetical protein
MRMTLKVTGKDFLPSNLCPGQARTRIDDRDDMGGDDMGGLLLRRDEDVERQLMQVDVTEFANLFFDNATLFLDHGRGDAIEAVTFEHLIDSAGRRGVVLFLPQCRANPKAIVAGFALFDNQRFHRRRRAARLPPRTAPLGQKVFLRFGRKIAVVILPKGLLARSVVLIKLPDAGKSRRATFLDRFIISDGAVRSKRGATNSLRKPGSKALSETARTNT